MGKHKTDCQKRLSQKQQYQNMQKVPAKQKKIRSWGTQKLLKIQKIEVKKGRPLNVNQRQRYNESDNIKNSIIKYLIDIGFKHGLVFTEKQRTSLREEQNEHQQLPRVQWDNQHTWKKQQEIQKIRTILQMNQKQKSLPQKLIELFLDIGDIFPREITSQIYHFLHQIYEIANRHIKLNYCGKQQLSAYVIRIMAQNDNSLIFMTNKFSKRYGSSKERFTIHGKLQKLCQSIYKNLKSYLSKAVL